MDVDSEQEEEVGDSLIDELSFDVLMKWPYIRFDKPFWESSITSTTTNSTSSNSPPSTSDGPVSIYVATQCINARAAIICGKHITNEFHNDIVKNVFLTTYSNAKDLLEKNTGGCKVLTEVNDIKSELVSNGPVITTKFQPTQSLLRHCYTKHQRDAILKQATYALIVGWKLLAAGEVWIVQPLYNPNATTPINGSIPLPPTTTPPLMVAFGQFGIDEYCIAPASNEPLELLSWEPGPYLDISVTDPKWRSWDGIDVPNVTSHDMKSTFFPNDTTIAFNIDPRHPKGVTVRNREKHAHTRRGHLVGMSFDMQSNTFTISIKYV